jgi:hypothetical protein
LTFGQGAQYKSCVKYSNLATGKISVVPKYFSKKISFLCCMENTLGKRKIFSLHGLNPPASPNREAKLARIKSPLCPLLPCGPKCLYGPLSAIASLSGPCWSGDSSPNLPYRTCAAASSGIRCCRSPVRSPRCLPALLQSCLTCTRCLVSLTHLSYPVLLPACHCRHL